MLKCQQLLAFEHLWAGKISCSVELSTKKFYNLGARTRWKEVVGKPFVVPKGPCKVVEETRLDFNLKHLSLRTDRSGTESSLIRVYTVCHSIAILYWISKLFNFLDSDITYFRCSTFWILTHVRTRKQEGTNCREYEQTLNDISFRSSYKKLKIISNMVLCFKLDCLWITPPT